MYLIDTFAWIEYLKGSKLGKKAVQFIEKEKAFTSVINITEIVDKYKRENLVYGNDLNILLSKARVLNVDFHTAVVAGEINAKMKREIKGWGMADSIILSTAKLFNLKIITGDEHFRNIGNVFFLK